MAPEPDWRHPIASCLDAVDAALVDVTDVGCWSLADVEVSELLRRAEGAGARLVELRLRLVRAADARDLAKASAATSTSAWLRSLTRVSRAVAGADVRLAAALAADAEATRRALAAGRVNVEQAQVITSALAALPAEVSVSDRTQAEGWLIEQAQLFAPEQLARLGKRVFEVIAPEQADAHEGQLLEAEERRARQLSRLAMRRCGDGTTAGYFRLPDAQADMLQAALDAICAPRRGSRGLRGTAFDWANGPAGDPPGDPPGDPARGQVAGPERLPYPVRLGLGFGELIEHLPVDRLPQHGGTSATVAVTIDYEQLRGCLGAAELSTGTRISAAQARRLACNAGLLPLVLSGRSTILDLGREQRLFDRYQRLALGVRDRGCVFPGCDRPPSFCEAHHNCPWSSGGATGLHNAALLCSWHHHLVHADGWTVRLAINGYPELVPPDAAGATSRPQQHQRFRQFATDPPGG